MPTKLILVAVLCLLVAGCSPRVRSNDIKNQPAQPDTAEVTIFDTREIDCPYEIVGTTTADRREGDDDAEAQADLLDDMMQRARKMGGNGIIINPGDWDHEMTSAGTWTVIGTVILVTDPGCKP